MRLMCGTDVSNRISSCAGKDFESKSPVFTVGRLPTAIRSNGASIRYRKTPLLGCCQSQRHINKEGDTNHLCVSTALCRATDTPIAPSLILYCVTFVYLYSADRCDYNIHGSHFREIIDIASLGYARTMFPSVHCSMGSAPVGVQCPLTSSLGEFPDH